ncbi:MAG TPA: hypothetical protein VN923_10800, partial [Thermoanaerobaculia bacterium]|nr:hypothetical protein [Thermoanaerobaculia bacterium]
MAARRTCIVTFAAIAASLLLSRDGGAKPPPPTPVAISGAAAVSRCADCQTWLVDVAAGPFGTFLAAWTDTTQHVVRRVFDADGNGGDEMRVGNATQEDLAGIAGDEEGWLVGWFQPGRVWARRLDGNGGGPATSTQVDETGLGDDHGTALVPAGDGTVMVWSRTTPGDAL